MQASTNQQTVLPSYEQAVRNPTTAEFQTATAPYGLDYPVQNSYPIQQRPYPVQASYPIQSINPSQVSYPTQTPYPIQTSQSTQPVYLIQQPPYPTQQPPYPTQQPSYPTQQQSYPTQQLPSNYMSETYGQVIAPPPVDAGQTIHVIRHVSTGNTGCSGKRGLWFGILLGLIAFGLLLRLLSD